MNSQQLVLTLYYPCVIQLLDQFIQTISLEVWLQNHRTHSLESKRNKSQSR